MISPLPANEATFKNASKAVAANEWLLMRDLVNNPETHNREIEAAAAHPASTVRFGR